MRVVPCAEARDESYPWWMPTCQLLGAAALHDAKACGRQNLAGAVLSGGCTPMTRLSQLPCEVEQWIQEGSFSKREFPKMGVSQKGETPISTPKCFRGLQEGTPYSGRPLHRIPWETWGHMGIIRRDWVPLFGTIRVKILSTSPPWTTLKL